MKKRLLSLFLALVMVLSVFPMTVFADGEAETAETTEAIEEIVEEVAEENEEEIPEEETEPEEEPAEELPTEEEPEEEPAEEEEEELPTEEEPEEELPTEEEPEDLFPGEYQSINDFNGHENIEPIEEEQAAPRRMLLGASVSTTIVVPDEIKAEAVAYVTDAFGNVVQVSDFDDPQTVEIIEYAGFFKTPITAVNAIENTSVTQDAESKLYKIGDGEAIYLTEDEALKAAASTVILLKNYTFVDDETTTANESCNGLTIPAGKVVALDLNGHRLSSAVNVKSKGFQTINNKGAVIIMDSTDIKKDGTGSGILTHGHTNVINEKNYEWGDPYNYGYCADVIHSTGIVVVESGKIYANAMGSSCTVDNYGQNARLYVNGGLMEGEYATPVRLCLNGCNENSTNRLVMKSGKIDGTGVSSVWIQAYKNNQKCLVNISGGTLTGGSGAFYALYDYAGTVDTKNVTYSISGGNFTGEKSFFTYGSNVYISGGTFDGTVAIKQGFEGTNVAISGGRFKTQVTCFDKYGKEKYITGGTFSDFPNYQNDYTLYNFGGSSEDGRLVVKRDMFTQLTEDSDEQYKTYRDYQNAGYLLNGLGWYYGYDYAEYDKDNSLVQIRLQKYEVINKKTNRVIDEIYVKNDAPYNITAEDAKAYRYEKSELYFHQYMYAYGQYYAGGWSTHYALSPQEAQDKAYDSRYAYPSSGYSSYYYTYPSYINNYLSDYTFDYVGTYEGMDMYHVYTKDMSKAVADGYVAEDNNDGTYTIRPKELYLGEVSVNPETSSISLGDNTIKVDGLGETESGDTITLEDAATAISNMTNNSSVQDFIGTNTNTTIENNVEAIKAALKEDEKIKDDPVAMAAIDALSEEQLLGNVDVDIVSGEEEGSELNPLVTTTPEGLTTVIRATYEVKPKTKTTVTNSDGIPISISVTIDNDLISEDEPIIFRIPVSPSLKTSTAQIWHRADKNSEKQDLGWRPVQTAENGDKFIEFAASDFSLYTYEILNLTATDKVAILDAAENYRGFTSLADAISDFGTSGNEDDTTIILLDDSEGEKDENDYVPFDFANKVLTLNLNGHMLIGESKDATNVTVTNEFEDALDTLAAVGTYANDVSAFVADGYDTKKTTVDNDTVFNSTAAGVFSVKVVPVPGSYTDHDSVTEGIDLYAGDTVKMDVRVYGAKFVGADVTLYYDKTNFKMTDAPTSGWDGDVKWYDSDESKLNGKTRFYAAKSTQGGASEYYNLNEDGYYSLGTFEFEALPGANEALKVAFQVEPIAEGEIGQTTVAPVYVAGAWSQGWDNSPANKLTQGADDTHLVNALVNVRLKSMSAVVNGETSLVYNATARNLVKSGAGAKDSISQQAILNPTIKYAVLTKAAVEGTPLTDASGNVLYYTTSEKTATSTTVTDWPAYETGKEPKVPADEAYTNTIPTETNAGEYVVFYRVSKDGYITVADKLNVSIAKKKVDLNWSATELEKGDGKSTDYESDFKVTYDSSKSETGFTAPTATYKDAGSNDDLSATVTLTGYNNAEAAEGTKLFKVGKYVYTATVNPNYEITSGETCTVEVEGKTMQGYKLIVPGTQDSPSTIGSVWYDGEDHVPAILDKAEVADPANPTVTYSVLKPGAHDWETVALENMKFTAAGTYQVKAVLTADNYYDLTTDTVTFTIKSATYVTEKFDWVTGWDVVLVYTNDIVPGFTYDGAKMYDVSALGYKYGTTKNADGTVGTTQYTHVFGLVIAGDADITKVKSSNVAAEDINYSTMEGNTQGGIAWARLDVNSSKSVELLDLVFVQGVYNVNETYMTQQMANVLKSDVNGDKMVDTRDCALIKANS